MDALGRGGELVADRAALAAAGLRKIHFALPACRIARWLTAAQTLLGRLSSHVGPLARPSRSIVWGILLVCWHSARSRSKFARFASARLRPGRSRRAPR